MKQSDKQDMFANISGFSLPWTSIQVWDYQTFLLFRCVWTSIPSIRSWILPGNFIELHARPFETELNWASRLNGGCLLSRWWFGDEAALVKHGTQQTGSTWHPCIVVSPNHHKIVYNGASTIYLALLYWKHHRYRPWTVNVIVINPPSWPLSTNSNR